MRILIDTNILIPLEDSSIVLEDSFGELVRLSNEYNHILLIHPSSIDDLNRDRDENRKRIRKSRIRKYKILNSPPIPTSDDIRIAGLKQQNDNDRVDNEILYSIYKDAANILVTEDRGIHAKARTLKIEQRVHYIQQTVEFLRRLHSKTRIILPNIQEVPLHQVDISNDFFDSLRANYSDFNNWFKKSAREGRTTWVYRSPSNQPRAILIYKEEENEIITDDHRGLPGKTLKFCTFKVGEEIRGRKIGELFLKAAFRYATANDIEYLYITIRSRKFDFLRDLCLDFGFYKFGTYRFDDVYVKDHPSSPVEINIPAIEYNKRFYPHFKCDSLINKFVIPIKPKFHRILFPDKQIQPSLFQYSPAGNAIKQAYLCHANIRKLSSGDILLFYRSHDLKALTSIGIVESVSHQVDPEKIIQIVSKRTVYSYEDIISLAAKRTLVILFRLSVHFPKNVPYRWLTEKGVVNGPIQTIRQISNKAFKLIVDEWGICNCFYAD